MMVSEKNMFEYIDGTYRNKGNTHAFFKEYYSPGAKGEHKAAVRSRVQPDIC